VGELRIEISISWTSNNLSESVAVKAA